MIAFFSVSATRTLWIGLLLLGVGITAQQLSSGAYFSCYISIYKKIAWFGKLTIDNLDYQTVWSDAHNTGRIVPPPSGEFEHISCGGVHCCALNSTGFATCFGNNTFSQARPPTIRFF